MFSSTRLLAFIALTGLLAECALPPGTLFNSGFDSPPGPKPDLVNTNTDSATIVNTVGQVDQTQSAAASGTVPDAPPPETSVTAVDGVIVSESIPGLAARSNVQRRVPGRLARRSTEGYNSVFQGKGLNVQDATIQGTAFLTYTLLPNSTYDTLACLDFCDSVVGCVFANLFYEHNNPELDAGSTNLKCAAFADYHTAAEKTDVGGRVLGSGLLPNFFTESSGWGLIEALLPITPQGYELSWGPISAAANAPGFMGFAFLDRYDVDACAQLCNTRGEDSVGGRCVFFNIWRAVVNGRPTTYTCSMYWAVAAQSTATNTGQGSLRVTFSRGYTRKNYVIDGSFEGYTGEVLSFVESYTNWVGTSSPGGHLDATFFYNPEFARTGHSLAILGSADGSDSLSGTITPKKALKTVAGKKYTLQFFHNSAFNGDLEDNAFVNVTWNGVMIKNIRPGNNPWTRYEIKLPVAKGNDVLSFRGGSFPSYSFIDDVSVLIGQA